MKSMIVLVVACAGVALTQNSFEVASIKPSAPDRGGASVVRGGPGSSDPGLARLENIDLTSLMTMAFGVKRYQVSAPDWMGSARFDIWARVPAGATVDQYQVMLQNLLSRRFELSLHYEQKEIQTYDLVVGKNGPKMKAAEPDPETNDGLQPPAPRAGGPPPGYHGPVNLNYPKISMDRFAALLSGLLGQPINDGTELKGNYEVKLRALTGANPPDAVANNAPPSIFDAVQEQLGLRLVPVKRVADVMVVDRIDKTPTEN
jgi:uncharacterized protein (TIGR03435 family)